jgi:hypothetical protein
VEKVVGMASAHPSQAGDGDFEPAESWSHRESGQLGTKEELMIKHRAVGVLGKKEAGVVAVIEALRTPLLLQKTVWP